MRLLLDTHVLIWLAEAPQQVPAAVSEAILGSERVYASVASGWEYGIKRRKRPDLLPIPFASLIEGVAEPLDLAFDCHLQAELLPPLHNDPFDRMLIAQALHHQLTLVTKDRHLRQYAVATLW